MTDPATGPELERICAQYFALVPPYLLRLPSSPALAQPESQRYLVDRLLEEDRYAAPCAGYRKSFWRYLVGQLERGVCECNAQSAEGDEIEVDERIYGAVAELMTLPSDGGGDPGTSYRTFIYKAPSLAYQAGDKQEEAHVSLLEDQAVIQAGTTGLRTWTAALHLAHHVLQQPPLLPSYDTIDLVELGAGAGFLSILLAQLGWSVMATDLEAEEGETRAAPLARLRHNVALTELKHPPRVRALDWSDASLSPTDRPAVWSDLISKPRVIVAADVIYDPDLVPLLVETLAVLLAPQTFALIAATVRNPSTLDLFKQTCARCGLLVDKLNLPPPSQDNATFFDTALDSQCPVEVMRICLAPSNPSS